MTDRADAGSGEDAEASIVRLGEARPARTSQPVGFLRGELERILRLYGRMVADGEWRDYAIDHLEDRAVFSVYRRSREIPMYRIVKDPRLARRQGAFAVIGADGRILKRGHELERVLSVFDRKLLSLVKA